MGRFFTTESLGKPHLPSERPKWERLEIYFQDLRAINNIYGTSLVAQWLRPIIYELLKRGLVIPCTSPYNALILVVCVCVFCRV